AGPSRPRAASPRRAPPARGTPAAARRRASLPPRADNPCWAGHLSVTTAPRRGHRRSISDRCGQQQLGREQPRELAGILAEFAPVLELEAERRRSAGGQAEVPTPC